MVAPFNFGLWLSALPVLLAAATFTWLLSLPLRNAMLVDSLWSLMLFAAGVVYALDADPRAPRLALVLWLAAIWAARLAIHITARNAGKGEDRRYQALRERHAPKYALDASAIHGKCQPPKNNTDVRKLTVTTCVYSPRKNSANFIELYSV